MCGVLPEYWNTPGLAETLWKCLIVDPIGPNEQDEAFLCLEAITEHHFAEYIYEKLLPDLDISSLTPKAWQCARQYFVVINWNRQLLTTVSAYHLVPPFFFFVDFMASQRFGRVFSTNAMIDPLD